MRTRAVLLVACMALCGTAAHAQPADAGTRAAARLQKPWGMPGTPKAVNRTIRILMTDDMRFTPENIEVREGDTVRFQLHNGGRVLHEMVIGTREKLDEHSAAMARNPGMVHRDPDMVHVRPGATKSLVWKFNRAGEFSFACLIAGHYSAGMSGTIRVFAQ